MEQWTVRLQNLKSYKCNAETVMHYAVNAVSALATGTEKKPLTLTLPGPSAGVSGSLDSYCSLKPLCSCLADPTSPIPSHCAVILFQSVAVGIACPN